MNQNQATDAKIEISDFLVPNLGWLYSLATYVVFFLVWEEVEMSMEKNLHQTQSEIATVLGTKYKQNCYLVWHWL